MFSYIRYQRGNAWEVGALIDDLVFPLNELLDLAEPTSSLRPFLEEELLQDEDQLRERSKKLNGKPIDQVQLLAPFDRLPHDLLCIGVNYQDHRDEGPQDWSEQENAVFFTKRAHYIAGTNEELHIDFQADAAIDYEVELAVVIGKSGKNIKKEDALDHVFGYTIVNDLSARTLQFDHSQWFKGKSIDGLTAMGPGIVPKSAIEDPQDLKLESFVNGQARQSGHSSQMIRGIAQLIHELSIGMTLDVGDVIATGTPAGVAMGMAEKNYLKPGDEVVCQVQGIGQLRNKIASERE